MERGRDREFQKKGNRLIESDWLVEARQRMQCGWGAVKYREGVEMERKRAVRRRWNHS